MLSLSRLYSTGRIQRSACPKLVDPVKIQAKIDKLPFFIERTKVGKSLPIYTDFRYNGQNIRTIIRRIYGDINKLHGNLRTVLPGKATIEVRGDLRQIKIKGNYLASLRTHFTRMGF